jgi:tetratricopeptide (TPR) repeat protein
VKPEELLALRERANAAPDNLDVQIEAAYACDRWGSESDAVVHYDLAWGLQHQIPQDKRAGFLVGYGSTLRNVGRLPESIAVLSAAVVEFPGDRSLQAFLALSQLDSGEPKAAVATLLDALLSLAGTTPDIAAYARALSHYRDELRSR